MAKLSKREAFKAAIRMGAAMVQDEDFYALFGDEIMEDAGDAGDDILAEAQAKACARILAIIGEKP